VFTALGAAHDKQREYNTKFEGLVTAKEILDAFGGTNVDPDSKTYKLDHRKANFTQSVNEQKATATLISLQSVAESEIQRRTVLLIGARLLNADPNYPETGGPAARLLTILIDQADVGRDSWNPSERHLNEHLWDTINSQSYKDLVTAGYSNDYYNDDDPNHMPTRDGDEPVAHDAKFQVLWKLTPADYDGWVHVAKYGCKFPLGKAPRPADCARRGAQPHTAQTAQYAIDPPTKPPPDPLFDTPQLVGPLYPRTLVMVKHRLLRSRPPVQFISPDGEVRKGSLGKIIGVVPAGSCIRVREPMKAVVVFLSSDVATPKVKATVPPKVKANAPPKVKANAALTGLVHIWAHVHGSKKAEEDCPSEP
jgi:hypothetical protein